MLPIGHRTAGTHGWTYSQTQHNEFHTTNGRQKGLTSFHAKEEKPDSIIAINLLYMETPTLPHDLLNLELQDPV